MRKSSKYVIVLCMLAVFLLPSTTFAAGKSCFGGASQFYSKISIERLQNLCDQFKELNLKDCNIQKPNKNCKINIRVNSVPAKPAVPAATKAPAKPAAIKAPAVSKAPAKPAA
ncbi:MAG: hypothetical protein PHR60_07345, partial [Eubacteriales bacterium]|nr:hypothetical protein [Eubacteriales bacterium]